MAQLKSSVKLEGGFLERRVHDSTATKTPMTFAVYMPPAPPAHTLYYLSGLTCTDENVSQKAHFAKAATRLNICLVMPDTSPRGIDIDGADESYDFGSGAGFYVDATEPKWATNYNMYTYVTDELPRVLAATYPGRIPATSSICGHSMGGHGALAIFLKNPGKYVSVSAFSPICNPTKCPWGVKAFTGYLGSVDAGRSYDASLLAASYAGPPAKILVDQGSKDNFLTGDVNQLMPEALAAACEQNESLTLQLRMQEGYDHSYFFISTFIDDHLEFHAAAAK